MAMFPKLAVEEAADLAGLGGLTGDELVKGGEGPPAGGVVTGAAAAVGTATVGEAAGEAATVGEAAGGEAGDFAGEILGAADGDLAGDNLGAGEGVGAAMEAELNNPKAKTKQRIALNRAILFVS